MDLDKSTIEKLPDWATYVDGVIQVDPSVAYPEYLELFEMEPNQYSIEVARRCMTLDLLEITGPGLMMKIVNPVDENGHRENQQWGMKNLPEHPEYGAMSMAKGSADGVRLHKKFQKQD